MSLLASNATSLPDLLLFTAPPSERTLNWTNVAIAFAFVFLDVVTSFAFGLGIGTSLLSAAARCVVQLSLVAVILRKVFESNSPWVVAFFAGRFSFHSARRFGFGSSSARGGVLLNLLGTFETVVNKADRRHKYMFFSTLSGMLVSSIPISIIGARFAMAKNPFWEPAEFIPIVGMLCGNTISGIVVSVNYLLKEVEENRDKVEMYLAFGATRMEACKPMATDALRLALAPIVNRMSVLGIISIPGMMTGAILGGASVEYAARLQVIIIFMISASTTLAAIVATGAALAVVVDGEHRVREDRVDGRPHGVYRAAEWVGERVVGGVKRVVGGVKRVFERRQEGDVGEGEGEGRGGEGDGERERLLDQD
ncbi:hypothetical protein PC9H_010643 [Pleurotus ostreatus]|uniref:Uncharacterized protein n=1 Tax=Pleurotus ostreatus TaxID=5322 RepID=A0A8H7DNI2_PLEOS|nr:uncharacterized protein PC9H_010643 [Pleurotus ostreatus]KAF7422487.1 hypothetical protein PC9H_010643 [Pleurotus ostreatus]